MTSAKQSNTISIFAIMLYMCMAIPMYFYIDGAITIGGFGFMYHYLYGMAIMAIAFFWILLQNRNGLILRLGKLGAVLSLSYIIPLILTCFIWAFEHETMEHMITGLFLPVYILLALCVGSSTVYLFREYSVLFSCLAMGAANLFIILQTASANFGEFISELLTLIRTFGEDTGPMMKSVEIHDLTFAFGLYLLVALIDREMKGRKAIILISLLFSLTGLKRIAVIGIALGACVYILLGKWKRMKTMGCIICLITVIFSFCWIIAIHAGFLDVLETTFHVDTKGRQLIFRQLNQLFSVSPFFLGRGIGWSKHAWDDLPGRNVIHDAFHDEYVRMYIENGFAGYFIWIYTNTFARFLYILKADGRRAGRMFIAQMLYLYATYSSDNTYYYYYTSLALFICLLAETSKHLEEGAIGKTIQQGNA